MAMKFTLGWLKDHLETDASMEDILRTLNNVGLEVERVEDFTKDLAEFKVARVIEAGPHPNADKLRVCRVETADGEVQVVCGAPNARTGMTAVFAPSGSYIPGTGITLKPTKIRGVESNGMLVSEREMMLSDEHDGIIDLPEGIAVGTPMAQAMGLDDPMIEIAITPNRPDCLGVAGVARDLAAAGLGRLKTPKPETVAGSFPSPIEVKLDFTPETASACSKFVGRLIRGVTNGPSPDWLQRRLRAVGLRPINALVDVTNYISYDRGRPLHVFDADKLQGHVHARLAKAGETLLGLDDKEHRLTDQMCVIADEAKVTAIGGVMGGEDTGCTEETRAVFVECAYFDPNRTARTGRTLGIHSDARFRFERGVDPAFLEGGMELATRMILDLCGGEASDVVSAGDGPDWAKTVPFDPREVLRLTGVEIDATRAEAILRALGFGVEGTAPTLSVSVPSWRPDIDGKADLVEEVVRIHGLDNVPSTPLPRLSPVAKPILSAQQERVRLARRALAERGLNEVVTWSFVPEEHAALFAQDTELSQLKLENPISSDLDTMRPNALPGLIAAVGRNIARGFADVRLFEAGPQFRGDAPEEQDLVVAGVRRGGVPRNVHGGARGYDVFDVKADVLGVLAAVGAPVASLQTTTDAPGWYHPGRSGVLRLGPKTVLARFGEVHPRALDVLDVKGPVYAFEIFPHAVPLPKAKPTKAKPELAISDLLPVTRDFAFVVDAQVSAETLLRAARGAEKTLIDEVHLFDVYEGQGVGEGKKSLAIEVTLQPRDKTLTDEEIDAVSAKIVAQVQKATGGTLRA